MYSPSKVGMTDSIADISTSSRSPEVLGTILGISTEFLTAA
jgi:hypothetical protein